MRLKVNRLPLKIYPNNKRVITRYFSHEEIKSEFIINKVISMSDTEAEINLTNVLREFAKRHRNITKIFEKNFATAVDSVKLSREKLEGLSSTKKLLIGSYFTMEYSIESAALYNPSIVLHPNQSNLEEGQKRIIISLRATGESHISSIVFRSGIIDSNGNIMLDPQGNYIGEAEVIKGYAYNKSDFINLMKEHNIKNDVSSEILNLLGDVFYYTQLKNAINKTRKDKVLNLENERSVAKMLWLARSHYDISFSQDTDISERVIFPVSRTESKGIEDARFVRFEEENGDFTYYATYTAYDGTSILPKIIETKDFYFFKNLPLHGECAKDKNFALFPKKIENKYAMLSRIDGMNQYIMFSDDITLWENAFLLQKPEFPWEFVQVGNAGSPIETDEGWLVLTHGVGPMRKYCLGIILLDLHKPQKLLARLKEPLIVPTEEEREGYVPNVVYTCGALLHNDLLIIPYSSSDYATSFATIELKKIMDALE